MRRGVVALSAVMMAGGAAAVAGTLSRAVVDRVAAACVLIQAVEGKEGSAGSGFFVGRNEVLTNYHVVKAAIEGDAKVSLVVGADPKTRKVADATVVAGNEELDLALLRSDVPSASTLRFAGERSLQLTQQVWVAGFPFGAQPGLEVTLTAGTITALRHNDAGELRQVQLDAAVNPGNSGGPVVDDKGAVVAVSVATIKPAVGSGMALAIPCGAAEKFLKVGRQARHRTGRVQVVGKPANRSLRVTAAEKAEEIWGTSVLLTVRATRGDDFDTLAIEVADRRREVLARERLDVGTLDSREEKPLTLRLRGAAFDDVAIIRIVE